MSDDELTMEDCFPGYYAEPADLSSSGVLYRPWMHPQWTTIGARCRIRTRRSVDFSSHGLDPELISQLRDVECLCARCGSIMHPFRARKGRTLYPRALVVSCTCTRLGCSRGRAAREAKASLVQECLDAWMKDHVDRFDCKEPGANDYIDLSRVRRRAS